jgi:estrogen-related receptor beta like 1
VKVSKHFLLFCYRPEYPEEELEEENIVEDDAELTLNKVEDNIFGVSLLT